MAGTFTVLMSVATLTNVVARYGFNSPIPWAEEFSRYAFIWLVFIGAVICTKHKKHICIDVVVIFLPKRTRLFFHLLAVLGAAVAGLILLQHPLAVALSAAAATIAPLLILKRLTGKRERMFYAQLPDTLSHLSGALKAGYSFLQAVDMVVEETLPPMSTELSRVITETRLGLPVETALDNMAARMNCMDFNWTVMAVKIQREVGGNLAEILEVLGGTIRERDRVQRQIKVLTAEGRLSAAILFLLPVVVAVLLFLINPGYLSELYTRIAGIALLTLAAGLMVAGGVWLRKVVRIEV